MPPPEAFFTRPASHACRFADGQQGPSLAALHPDSPGKTRPALLTLGGFSRNLNRKETK
jgi:hypothetical protein